MMTEQDNTATWIAILTWWRSTEIFSLRTAYSCSSLHRSGTISCPGVTDTGFFNQHFIRDIGLIQLFLGVAFVVGLFKPERRIGLWLVATLWLAAHALSTYGKWPWASVRHRPCSATSPLSASRQSSGRS